MGDTAFRRARVTVRVLRGTDMGDTAFRWARTIGDLDGEGTLDILFFSCP
jgi:hypothetical protein